MEQTTWVVARLGAYMHYAVPRILHHAGRLERLYTDFYTGTLGTHVLSLIPKRWRSSATNRALGRSAPDLPLERIWSYPLLGVEYYIRQARARNPEERDEIFLLAGSKFGKLVTRDGFGRAGAVYAYNTAALEVLRAAKQQGLVTTLEQTIAPRALEEELLTDEQRRFPGWELARIQGPSTIKTVERERAEWELADLIVCGSEFVRQGVGHCGGPVEKCFVVPYGVDARFSSFVRSAHYGPLRVLTVGEAGLRKGIPYAAEVARLLGDLVEFRWVGPISLLPDARKYVRQFVQLTGGVPRNQIFSHFEWADVFFLPSVCEGSATVTYEALISGLPVIATPNTGSIVTDGVNGYIAPTRDIQAMADTIRRLHVDRELLSQMQKAALNTTKMASLEGYGQRLLWALSKGIRKGSSRISLERRPNS